MPNGSFHTLSAGFGGNSHFAASPPSNAVTVGGSVPGQARDRPQPDRRPQSRDRRPGGLIDVHNTYRLTVKGAQPGVLTGTSGTPLSGTGIPGTDYVTTITRATLVGLAGTSDRTKTRSRGIASLSAHALDAFASSGDLA